MNKNKIYKFPLESVVQVTQQGTVRFVNGFEYVVLSEVESFKDYNNEMGKIILKSGSELFIKKPIFNEFVDAMTMAK